MSKEMLKNLIELVPEEVPEPDEIEAILEGRKDREKMGQFPMMQLIGIKKVIKMNNKRSVNITSWRSADRL